MPSVADTRSRLFGMDPLLFFIVCYFGLIIGDLLIIIVLDNGWCVNFQNDEKHGLFIHYLLNMIFLLILLLMRWMLAFDTNHNHVMMNLP